MEKREELQSATIARHASIFKSSAILSDNLDLTQPEESAVPLESLTFPLATSVNIGKDRQLRLSAKVGPEASIAKVTVNAD